MNDTYLDRLLRVAVHLKGYGIYGHRSITSPNWTPHTSIPGIRYHCELLKRLI
ncbi:hypothetical protein PILCRDRAFT_815940 [Piloderma croceum F 1598]|uniref:Uncharacterized protein n=1 Tax=Piloderma croceum (strain F 1598) TaxID=765440 RepID=A0A0C3CAH8_PILCF|nr:hypothetical protein PILCRDRAFT_815940 [Piloderma croceum F 1598]